MAYDFSLVVPVQYPTQKPSTARSDFDKFINKTVDEYDSLAKKLTFFRQIRAEAKAKAEIALANGETARAQDETAQAQKAHQEIQNLHSRVEQLNDKIQPVLDAMDKTLEGLPRRGL